MHTRKYILGIDGAKREAYRSQRVGTDSSLKKSSLERQQIQNDYPRSIDYGFLAYQQTESPLQILPKAPLPRKTLTYAEDFWDFSYLKKPKTTYQNYFQPPKNSVKKSLYEKSCAFFKKKTPRNTVSFNFYDGQSFFINKILHISLASAMIFGMVLATVLYQEFGQSALAQSGIVKRSYTSEAQFISSKKTIDVFEEDDEEIDNGGITRIMEEIEKREGNGKYTLSQEEFEKAVRELVEGYPIEEMLPQIFKRNRLVATYLIAIGKKESNWGKRIPVYKGENCFNYWGYRGQAEVMGSGGHTCFNSPEEAVDTVANRLKILVEREGFDTPQELVVWKCGYSCAAHSEYSVNKWIQDVNLYYSVLYK